jgi:hypothetical protein
VISVRSVQAVSAAVYYQIRTLSILKPRTWIAASKTFEAGNDFGQIGPAVSGGGFAPVCFGSAGFSLGGFGLGGS